MTFPQIQAKRWWSVSPGVLAVLSLCCPLSGAQSSVRWGPPALRGRPLGSQQRICFVASRGWRQRVAWGWEGAAGLEPLAPWPWSPEVGFALPEREGNERRSYGRWEGISPALEACVWGDILIWIFVNCSGLPPILTLCVREAENAFPFWLCHQESKHSLSFTFSWCKPGLRRLAVRQYL